jgi:hypothetical protein
LERAVFCDSTNSSDRSLSDASTRKSSSTRFPPDTQREIARFAIAEELARLQERGFDLTVSAEAFEFLVRRGLHKALGARPLKKTVQKFIEDAVCNAIKSGAPASGALAVSLLNERLVIQSDCKQGSSYSHFPNVSLR